jgi:ABC-type branched-subunit amino acid transport system substrate-binding protein
MTMRDAQLLQLLLLLVGAGACQQSGTGGAPAGGGVVTLGAIFSETGQRASGAQGELRAARLAVDEINAAGGVLGGALGFAERNDNQDTALAIAAAHELVDQLHVPAIVGADSSSIAIAISTVTIPAKVVLMSGSATSPAISTLVDDDYVFRTCASDTQQGQLISERARARGFKRVGVVHEPGAYGTGLGFAFAVDFEMYGGTITDVLSYGPGNSSYQNLWSILFAKNPEAVLQVAYPTDAGNLIKDYVFGFVFHEAFFYFSDSQQEQSFVTSVGASNFTFGHEGTGPGTATGDAYTTYVNAYQAKYGEQPGTFSPNDYDAVYLIALAIVQAGRADGTAIRDHLRQVANPPGMVFGPGQFAQAAAAIKAGVKINYEGASGPVDLDENGDALATYVLWHVNNGTVTVVERGLTP